MCKQKISKKLNFIVVHKSEIIKNVEYVKQYSVKVLDCPLFVKARNILNQPSAMGKTL